jgi:hypothetical protein
MTFRTNAVKIQAFAGALYGIQLGTTTMAQVNADITTNGGLLNTLNGYYATAFGSVANATVAASVAANLGLTGDALASGTAYITAQLNSAAPASRGAVISTILDQFAVLTADATFGAAATAWNTKVEAANAYTGATNAAVGSTVGQGTAFTLTPGADNIAGTANNDTFTASVGGNNDTLQSDDVIGGGAGTDTLDVTLANTPFAITPRSSSVEILKVRSQANGDDEGTNDVQGFFSTILKNTVSTIVTAGDNTIDAQNMVGTSQFWNSNSRADLVVEDIRNKSHETTLGFQSTDPGDVDYAVFFDPSHITSPAGVASGATLTMRLADVLGLKVDTNGLKNLPYNGMTITVGTKDAALAIDFSKLTSYADFVTAINAELVKAGLTTITATAGTAETAVFSTAVSGFAQGSVAGTFNPVILTNSGPDGVTLKGYSLNTGAQEPNGNLVRTATLNEKVTVNALTQVNMILDDVGRGSMAGDFLAGSMSTGASGSKGIAQFNVSVDRSSHITTLQTTNNGLEVVNVKNIGANGNLRLDDNNLTDTDYGLTDVRVFDAATMTGKVTLSAVLSSNVVAKYMDLTDTGTPSGDNSDPLPFRDVVDQEFSYDLGNGNDSLYLNISNENLAAAGTTTREDFVLTINGNAGDDAVTVQIGDGVGVGDENWYTNSTLNANLSINTGEGNDTVRTQGAGNWACAI